LDNKVFSNVSLYHNVFNRVAQGYHMSTPIKMNATMRIDVRITW